MTIEIIIEIVKGSRNKYELDKESGRIKLDRVLRSSVGYPADYGMLPGTMCDDGDPLDVLVINRFSTFPGCLVDVRPIGIFRMVDKGENDEKILAVPVGDVYYDSWKDLKDVPESLIKEIEQFFMTYKALENKKVESNGWGGVTEAEKFINTCKVIKIK